jgi:hypothetical protein
MNDFQGTYNYTCGTCGHGRPENGLCPNALCASRGNTPAPTTPEALPWQPVAEADLAAAEAWLMATPTRAGFIPADAAYLANITAHMIREVRAARAALADTAEGQQAAPAAADCACCQASGTVRVMTSHLGPDDYEFDEECAACAGTGSADIRDAINALPYQSHTVKPHTEMVSRKLVLQIIEARAALAAPSEWQQAAGTLDGLSDWLRSHTGRGARGTSHAQHHLWADAIDAITATPPAPATAPAARGLTDAEDAEPLTDAEIEMHIGPDEGDREAVTAVVRQVERRFCVKNGIKLAAIDAARALKGGAE